MEDNPKSNPKNISLPIWFYLVIGGLVLGLLAWSSLRLLQETSSREVNLEYPGKGWLTFKLVTDPFPPLPSGIVKLTLNATNSQGVMVDLDPSLPFTFGANGSEIVMGDGNVSLSSGEYHGNIQFPTPGDYWLVFDLGNNQQAKYSIYVKPAQ